MKRSGVVKILLLLLIAALLVGCGVQTPQPAPAATQQLHLVTDAPSPQTVPPETAAPVSETETPAAETEAPAPEETPAVTEDGEYTAPADVALYLHLFGHLPDNFITKNEARDLGWDSSKGNLWTVAPGKSIGGDRFGNYEGLLPKGSYIECDVNYAGGYRGSERIIYGADGSVWYTSDHYKSFEQLY